MTFCKNRHISCSLIDYFVQQIFTENILSMGSWSRGAGTVGETRLGLTYCPRICRPQRLALKQNQATPVKVL